MAFVRSCLALAICAGGLVFVLAAAPRPALAQGLPAPDFIAVDGFEALQAMRIDTMELRDPHLFSQLFTCMDITSVINGLLSEELIGDADEDGFLDASPMLLFRPLHTSGRRGLGQAGSAACSVPAGSTSCHDDGEPRLPLAYDSLATGTCLAPLPGSTGGYSPTVMPATGPCFVADATGLDLVLGSITALLREPGIAASRREHPQPGLTNGLFSGFLAETAANDLMLELPLIGTVPLSSLLAGGSGNCAAHSDKDLHEGEPGWWFYFQFSATQVPYQQ